MLVSLKLMICWSQVVVVTSVDLKENKSQNIILINDVNEIIIYDIIYYVAHWPRK